jgi:hypothetical protein
MMLGRVACSSCIPLRARFAATSLLATAPLRVCACNITSLWQIFECRCPRWMCDTVTVTVVIHRAQNPPLRKPHRAQDACEETWHVAAGTAAANTQDVVLVQVSKQEPVPTSKHMPRVMIDPATLPCKLHRQLVPQMCNFRCRSPTHSSKPDVGILHETLSQAESAAATSCKTPNNAR